MSTKPQPPEEIAFRLATSLTEAKEALKALKRIRHEETIARAEGAINDAEDELANFNQYWETRK